MIYMLNLSVNKKKKIKSVGLLYPSPIDTKKTRFNLTYPCRIKYNNFNILGFYHSYFQ